MGLLGPMKPNGETNDANYENNMLKKTTPACKRGQGVDIGSIEKQLHLGLEPSSSGFQVWRPNQLACCLFLQPLET